MRHTGGAATFAVHIKLEREREREMDGMRERGIVVVVVVAAARGAEVRFETIFHLESHVLVSYHSLASTLKLAYESRTEWNVLPRGGMVRLSHFPMISRVSNRRETITKIESQTIVLPRVIVSASNNSRLMRISVTHSQRNAPISIP